MDILQVDGAVRGARIVLAQTLAVFNPAHSILANRQVSRIDV